MKPAYQFIVQTLMVLLWILQNSLGGTPSPSDPSPLIPRQSLADFPNYEKASISPDGNYLTFLKFNTTTYKVNLWLLEVKNFDPSMPDPLSKGNPLWSVENPSSFQWLFDGKTILTEEAVDNTTKAFKFFNVETSQETTVSNFGFAASVKGLSQLKPQEVLVQDISADGKFHFYILNKNGNKEEIPVTGDFVNRLFDHNFQDKVGFRAYGPDDLLVEAFKKGSGGAWEQTPFWKTKGPEDTYMGAIPTQLNLDGDAFFWINVEDYKYGTFVKTNITTGESTVVMEPKKGDVMAKQTAIDPRDQSPAWVTTEYYKQKIFVLKPDLKADIQALQLAAPGEISLMSASTDFNLWVVKISDFDQVPKWFLYNRKTKKAQLLFKEFEKLGEFTLNPMYPIEVTSYDGLKLVCWYYIPTWLDANKNGIPVSPVPTIVFIHGGPWFSKADWGNWHIHQLLTNRGFVSIECNYRGGMGFGREFFLAGKREVGAKEVDDIMAGLDELVKIGVADPGKVGAFGESYGGYSAAVLQVRYSDRFKCTIDVYGGGNYLQNIIDTQDNPNLSPQYKAFDKQMMLDENDPKDWALIHQLSPVYFLNNITNPPRPMLILHGLEDHNAMVNASEQLAWEMKKHKIPVTFGVFPGEGHGFRQAPNTWAYHALVENVLHRCVGAGRVEQLNVDFPYSTLQIRESGLLTELKSKEVPWHYP